MIGPTVSEKKLFQPSVAEVKRVAKDIYLLQFHEPYLSRNARAGQFIEIKAPFRPDILWRRPFSIHNVNPGDGAVEILFHALGRGTEALTRLGRGDAIDILGPLGNSFNYGDELREAIIVAGGLGIAPFRLMQRELALKKVPITMFYGVGGDEQFYDLGFFEAHTNLKLSTIDGSRGYKGVVTDLLSEYLEACDNLTHKAVYVCGPTPMLRRVREIVRQYRIPTQVSVETIMACGFGACVGCAVPLAHPQPGVKEYVLACKDGPVFNIEEIVING